MIRLELNPDYAELLAANRMSTYGEVMASDEGTVIEANEERDVRRLQLNDRVFYLKRVWCEKTSVALESYLGGSLAHSRPYRKMQQFRNLRAHRFEVADIAAVGEEIRFGIPQQGFILTRGCPDAICCNFTVTPTRN